MVIVPLEMAASMQFLLWWTWPALAVCAWWWADKTWTWTWCLAVEAGVIGAQWAYLGAAALVYWPTHRLVVGGCWIAYAAGLAGLSYLARRHAGNDPTYNGY